MSVDGMAARARRLAEMEAAQASREQQARSEWESLSTRARALGQPIPEGVSGRLSTVLAARADALGTREEAITVLERSLSDWRAGLERVEDEDQALKRLRDRLRSTLADEIVELSPAELSRVVARAFGERRRTGPLGPVRAARGPSAAVEQEAALLDQLLADEEDEDERAADSLGTPLDTVVHPAPEAAGTRTVEAARIEEYDPVTLDPFVAFEDSVPSADDALVTLTGDGPADIGALLGDARPAVRRPRSLMREPAYTRADDDDDIDIDIDIDEADLEPGEDTLARWLGTTVEPQLDDAPSTDAVDADIEPLDDADSLLEWEAAGLGHDVAMLVERRRPASARTSVNEIAQDPFDAFDDFDDSLDAPFGFVEHVTGQGPALEGADWSMDDGPTPTDGALSESDFEELKLDDPFAEDSVLDDGRVVDTGEIDGVDFGEAFPDLGSPLGADSVERGLETGSVVEVSGAFEAALSAAFARNSENDIEAFDLDAFEEDEDVFDSDFAAELDAAFAEDAAASPDADAGHLDDVTGASIPEASLPEPSVPEAVQPEAGRPEPAQIESARPEPAPSPWSTSERADGEGSPSEAAGGGASTRATSGKRPTAEADRLRVTNRPTARPWSPTMADSPPGGSLLPAPPDPGQDGWGPRALQEPVPEPEPERPAPDDSVPDHVATDFGAALIDPTFDPPVPNPFEVPSLTQPAAAPMSLSGSTDPGRPGDAPSARSAATAGRGALPLDLDADALQDGGFGDTQLTGLDWPPPRALHAFPDGSMDSGSDRAGERVPDADPRGSAEEPWAALDSDILADALSDALAPLDDDEDGDWADDTPFGSGALSRPISRPLPVLEDSADVTARAPGSPAAAETPAAGDPIAHGMPDNASHGMPGNASHGMPGNASHGIGSGAADDIEDGIWHLSPADDSQAAAESVAVAEPDAAAEPGAADEPRSPVMATAVMPAPDAPQRTGTAAYGAIDPDPARRSGDTQPFDPRAFAAASDEPALPSDPWRSHAVAPSASLADALHAARRADEVDPIDAALDAVQVPDDGDEQRRITDRFAALAGDIAEDPWASLDIPAHGDDAPDALPELMRRRQGRPIREPERKLPAPARATPSEPEPESAPRASLGVRVGIEAGDQFFTGFSRDISVDGMFVKTQHGLTVGDAVEVFFELPGGRSINARGLVQRVKRGDGGRPSGLGLRFHELTREARVHIGRYVSRMLTGKIPLP